MTKYGITSRDYLARAASLRNDGGTSTLLYAALELRFGIEARLHEYLKGAAKVATIKKDLWQIKNLIREVEGVVGEYDKAVVITCIDKESGVERKLEYTPVTKRLKKVGEKLGNYLHYSQMHKIDGDTLRRNLIPILDEGITWLKFATRGTLICPPLGGGRDGGQIQLIFENECVPDFIRKGAQMKLKFKAILVSKDDRKAVIKFSQEER